MIKKLKNKKVKHCLLCLNKKLEKSFFLGNFFVSNFVNKKNIIKGNIKCPLNLLYCPNCSLIQLSHIAPQELMYRRYYWYKSGVTKTMRLALKELHESSLDHVQLNTKDAALFVYKKTIFDVNNEYRKEFASIKNGCSVTNNIDSMIKLYTNYISHIVYDYPFTADNKIQFIKHFNNYSSKFSQTILNLSLNISEEDYSTKLEIVHKFDQLLSLSNGGKLQYIILFLKKIQKKNITLDIVKQKCNFQENNHKLITLSPAKYVNWIFH